MSANIDQIRFTLNLNALSDLPESLNFTGTAKYLSYDLQDNRTYEFKVFDFRRVTAKELIILLENSEKKVDIVVIDSII